MKILVSGASGLIGSALVPVLNAQGHRVIRLVRQEREAGEEVVRWDPSAGRLEAGQLEGVQAVVHLAGESIASGRWTAEKKARIRDSRVIGTWLLCEKLAQLGQRPELLVCASAIGYYGDRGEEVLTEESPSGTGFLAEVCREWEAAAEPARQKGIRVVHLRLGVVLSAQGGALGKLLFPFRMGMGGRVGSGNQYMSWIALDDVVGAIQHTFTRAEHQGPVNAVAPDPVTNREFTKTLGRVLHRPTVFPLPAFMARLMLGEMADELLLASTRVQPTRLQRSGYAFRFPQLEGALRHLLGRTEPQMGKEMVGQGHP